MKLRSLLLAASAAFSLALAAIGQTPAPAPDAASLHKEGLARFEAKDFKAAMELAEQATKADATKPEYFSQLGIAISQRMNEVNFMQMAIMSARMRKAFEKSIELDPNHIAGLIGLCRYYSNAPEIAGGSLERAKEFAERVRKLVPFQGEIELGDVARKGEAYAEALPHYEAALALRPDSPRLLKTIGDTLVKLDRKADARARYEAALKVKADYEPARKALAELDKPSS